MRTYLLDLPDDPALIAQMAFSELRALRRAEHHFQSRINRAAASWLLLEEIQRLNARVAELEARQRRRDEAAERWRRKPVGGSP